MFEVRKASCELKRREYLKLGGYHECIADENDTQQKTLAKFETIDEAKAHLEGKKSYISTYPSNRLVKIEEYYIEEFDEDGDSWGVWYVAPLDEDSKKYTKDIYGEDDEE